MARPVAIVGPPGAGKSRLVRELRGRLDGVRWVTARADPLAPGTTLGLLAQLVRAAVGAQEGRATLDGIRAALGGLDEPTRARVAELFAELLRVPVPTPSPLLQAARIDPGTMRDQLRTAFAQWLTALLEEGPVVLELEDLHWGDGASVDAIDAVLAANAARPLLVIAIARPEVAHARAHGL